MNIIHKDKAHVYLLVLILLETSLLDTFIVFF